MGFDVGGNKGAVKPAMNVTPLVDVVLVLLIIFMVITPLLTKQFRINLPDKPEKTEKAPPPSPDQVGPVVLALSKDGVIRLGTDVVEPAQLTQKMERVLAARVAVGQDASVFFDADDDAPYGLALDVIDLGRSGGAVTIAVLTDPLPKKP